jgi:hypothetical protein
MTPEERVELREERRAARTEILQAVNNFKRKWDPRAFWKLPHHPTMLSPKNINEAVHIARKRKLVSAETLRKAGFND